MAKKDERNMEDLDRIVHCDKCDNPVVLQKSPKGLWCPRCRTSLQITVAITPAMFRSALEGTPLAEIYDDMIEIMTQNTSYNGPEIELIVANELYKSMKTLEAEIDGNRRKDKPKCLEPF